MSISSSRFRDPSPDEKRAQLKKLVSQRAGRTRTAPASFAQERLWVLEQLMPGTPVYTEAGALRIQASLDSKLFQEHLDEVVRRHEALRTTFGIENGKPVQRIAATLHVPVTQEDLRHLPAEQREVEAALRATEYSRAPFDLARGPLLRFHLIRLDDTEHVLVVTLHHIIADGWSIGVLVQELLTLFVARGSSIPKLPIQYADFARWQREWLQGEVFGQQLDYWKVQLAGVQVLELPTDHPRPAARTFNGAAHSLVIGERLTRDLRSLCRREGTTLFMTLLAGFQTLLHRHTGGREDDIVIGSPVAGRKRRELEGLIGFFVNMLPLRVDLSGNPTYRELLGRVREVCLGAYAHDDIPFERLVDELQPDRDLAHAPLFQVVFALHRNVMEIDDLDGISVRPLDVVNGTAKYDLTLFLWEGAKSLTGCFEYNTDLFDAATIERMAGHLSALLEAVVANPELRLSEIPLLNEEERRAVLTGHNTPGVAFADGPCLHERFETQVEQAPDAVAVVFQDRRMTFRELNCRANQLAHHLRGIGVGPEVRVALYLERSLDVVVAILAVLKAGGAYVPIDPEYPSERVRFMLGDARVAALLVSDSLYQRLPEHEAHTICLDRDWDRIAKRSEGNPPPVSTPDNLAYVIYTSGSTGKPKGVEVTHGNVVRLFEATDDWFRFDATGVWTLFHSSAFDFSVWELWGALLHGGRLVVVPYLVSRSTDEFYALVRREGVTVLNQTPSAFRQFMRVDQQAQQDDELALRLVIFGGEALDFHDLQPWFARHAEDRPRLVNMYGITETTVHVTYRPIAAAEVAESVGSSVGRPIPDLQLYILDGELNPVPIGVPGEIHVGGHGLARGYLGRPDLTAERFVPDPFGGEAGARLYRTGDLARSRSDGEIEYLGRIDHQVKIRGFRIELGEIESVLQAHPAVRQAVVLVREYRSGDRRLVGYVVADEPPPAGELRALARTRLPDYMMPAAFVTLDALPLTPNGKLDRRALPAPEATRPELGQAFVAPTSSLEQDLAGIWREVLGVGRVGVHDNFFELGGDSILAIQVASKAAAAGIRVSAKHLFQYQTIAELASVAQIGKPIQAEQGLLTGDVRLTPIQRWFFERDLERPQHYNQAVLLEAGEGLEPELLGRAVERLVAHHDALRFRYRREKQGWTQRYVELDPSTEPVFRRVDLSGVPAPERAAALERAADELQSSLDLEQGPLMRVAWFDMGGGGADRLLLVIHHLAVDGVSWRILLEDLLTGHEQLRRNLAPQLPAKTTSFGFWSKRLVEHAASGGVDTERDYWLGITAGPTMPLPLDKADGNNVSGSAETVEVSLSESDTRSLLQEVPAAYRTQINDVLLTALTRTLGSWTGDGSVLLDLEGHGREELFEDVDLSRTVGWFTTLYPVRLSLEPGSTTGRALKSVKEQLRSIPGRGLGYGLLRHLRGDAELAARLASRAEVSFNYLGQFDAALPEGAPVRICAEPPGSMHAASAARSHLLEINGAIDGGRLRMAWTFSRNLHRRETIETLSQRFMESLRELIVHCLEPEAGGATPSDFPLATLDQAKLDLLVGRDRNIEDLYPLSPLQSGMLFHSLYSPDSAVYCAQLTCRLEGVDRDAFRLAWQDAVEQHPILRTRFIWDEIDEPLQVVERRVELPWQELDWRELDGSEHDQRLEALLGDDRSRGFDLTRAPLMRLTLIRLTDDTCRFVWSHHHLLLDGWSLAALLRDVMMHYEGRVRQVDPPAERVRPYRDYIAWLRSRDGAEAETFWRQELAGVEHSTPLVVDRPQRTDIDPARAFVDRQIEISESATAALEQLARKHQLTMNTIVQGAWALLLSRYSGQNDVLFGTTFSGRSNGMAGIESMVGVLINTLPVRVRVDPERSVSDWLEDQQRHMARLTQHETTPLVQVQGWSDVPRGAALFESLFIFENYPIDRSLKHSSGSMQVSDASLRGRAHYPLTVLAAPGPPLLLRMAYDRRRFDESAIDQMLGHLRNALEAIAAAPGQTVRELPLLADGERRRLLVDWKDSEIDHAPDVCLHELFEAQVERTPDAPAVIFEGLQLSYRELNRRANQLAHHLRSLGVGREVPVAICMPRTIETIVGLIGTLKAGGVYVPIDARTPVPRIAVVLEDCGASVLLTHSAVADRFTELPARRICLDTERETIAAAGDDNPGLTLNEEAAEYIIYTSGSTGVPKGVVVEHRQVRGYVRNIIEALGVRDGASFGMVQPLSVDSSQSSIFPPLVRGGAVHVISEDVSLEAQALADYFERNEVDVLKIAPSHLAAMQRATDPERVLPRGWLVVGGEASRWDWAARLPEMAPRCRIFNHYGPTEATVGVSTYDIREGGNDGSSVTVPIGRPLPFARTYVLDRELNPVPVGVPGELYIGGAAVARGYLGRPDLTAAVFVPDPFGARPGSRLYRSGDLCRWRANGTIEFLGRHDQQVKIRGFRIELREVEAALSLHDQVGECAVVAREDEPGKRRLVAYVVPTSREQAPTIDELRSFLAERLPDPMIPSAFMTLDGLPRTHHGKMNLEGLPAPDEDARPDLGGYVEPRTEVERKLAGIWSAVLEVDRVGIHDDFFELGGHSLLATLMMSRVREAFRVELPLRELFDASTVASMAEAIGRAQEAPDGAPLVRAPRNENLLLSYAQERLWFLEQLAPGDVSYNMPGAIRLSGPLDLDALERSFDEIVRRHAALRTTFTAVDGQPVQVVAPQLKVEIPIIDLSGLAAKPREAEVRRRVREEALRPFRLDHDPLLRVALLRLGEEEHVLLATMHHIVSDGWSVAVLIREFVLLYEAMQRGEPSPLAELELQYTDFAHWQRKWLVGETLEGQLGYWRKQLAGLPRLELPTDRPRPKVRSNRGAHLVFDLDAALGRSIRVLSLQEQVTPFMTLLAAFKVVLRRRTGQSDLAVGTDIAGRNRAGLEGLIGFFVNQLVIRTQLSGDRTFRELLQGERDVTLDAYAQQDLPFEKVVAAINPRRDLSRSPLFDVKLVLQNMPMPQATLSGLTIELVETDFEVTKLDLLMNLRENGDSFGGLLTYSTELFDASTVAAITREFETLLRHAVAAPDSTVDALQAGLDREEKGRGARRKADRRRANAGRLRHLRRPPVGAAPPTGEYRK